MLATSELKEWLENLAPSNNQRRKIIIDLLRHKGEDHMSLDDITDCHAALKLLDSSYIPERPGPMTLTVPAESEMEH